MRALVALGVPHAHVGRRTVCTAAAWVAAIEGAAQEKAAVRVYTDAEVIAMATTSGRKKR